VVRGDGVRRYGQGSVQAYGLGATRLSPRASSCTGSQSFLNEEPAPPSIAYLPRRRERPPELESGGGPPTPPIFFLFFLFRVGTFVKWPRWLPCRHAPEKVLSLGPAVAFSLNSQLPPDTAKHFPNCGQESHTFV